ncbi:MAG: HAD-IA family hydrolase [Proteobacteria bacterium]|nr:HAD-IA family hydrolase [Pseudomonadota bacterium]
MLRALLWDVDGTLAETERDGHLAAFNRAFEAHGLPWRWSEARYGELLRVAGGRERLLADLAVQPAAPTGAAERAALVESVHRLKNRLYAGIVASGALPLRPGVRELIEECGRARLRLGIVTTTSRANLEALLAAHFGGGALARFAVTVCAEEAPRKKPDPQAYRVALDGLRLAPSEALAIEDSPAGVGAARSAGVPVIAVRSAFFAHDDCPGALAVGPSLGARVGWRPVAAPAGARVDLALLAAWHRGRPD